MRWDGQLARNEDPGTNPCRKKWDSTNRWGQLSDEDLAHTGHHELNTHRGHHQTHHTHQDVETDRAQNRLQPTASQKDRLHNH